MNQIIAETVPVQTVVVAVETKQRPVVVETVVVEKSVADAVETVAVSASKPLPL